METAIFAGGCFWGMEELFRKLPGVIDTEVGYAGGNSDNPTYNTVKTGTTGHAETLKIDFDPAQISYESLLYFFFKIHDPTTENRQGNDVGTQYRSVIFYTSEEQRQMAESVIGLINKTQAWKKPIVTQLEQAGQFFNAEKYHQDYLQQYPEGYTCHFIRPLNFKTSGSGSDQSK